MIKSIYLHIPAFLPKAKQVSTKLFSSTLNSPVWQEFEQGSVKKEKVLMFEHDISTLSETPNEPLLGMQLVHGVIEEVLYHKPSNTYYSMPKPLMQFIRPYYTLENIPMVAVNITVVNDTLPAYVEEVSYSGFIPVAAIERILQTPLDTQEELPRYPVRVEEQLTCVKIDGSNIDNHFLVEIAREQSAFSSLIHFRVPGTLGWLNLDIDFQDVVPLNDMEVFQVLELCELTKSFTQSKYSLLEVSKLVEMNAELEWEQHFSGDVPSLATVNAYLTSIQQFMAKYPEIVKKLYKHKLREDYLQESKGVFSHLAVNYPTFEEANDTLQTELALEVLTPLYFQAPDQAYWRGDKISILLRPLDLENNRVQIKSLRVLEDEVGLCLRIENASADVYRQTKQKVDILLQTTFTSFDNRGDQEYPLQELKAQLTGIEQRDIELVKAWLRTILQQCHIGVIDTKVPQISQIYIPILKDIVIQGFSINKLHTSKELPKEPQTAFQLFAMDTYYDFNMPY
jgi:hypothetical protein